MGELLISSAAGKHQAHRPAQLSYYTKLKSRAHLGGTCSALQPDPNAAFCSKAMWDAFPEDWKDKCVLEEAYVIALERKLIPNVFGGEKYVSPQDAIQWSLMRIATTLCSGWFRQWACDNWVRIVSKVDSNYFDKFLSAIDDGKIQMSSGVNYVEND